LAEEAFLAELRLFSFSFPPRGWAQCNGQLLPINQNQALFSLMGTMYGGNGQTNFGLPDLRGRVPMHSGGAHTQGERSGEESHTLIAGELPAHTHVLSASASDADFPLGTGNVLAPAPGAQIYSTNPTGAMDPASVTPAGGNQAHVNTQPSLVLNWCICLVGIFPSRE
jgi:microcystin-dependent protein